MENEFSMRELERVFLKTTYPIEIGKKQFEAGETLCIFDKIQIANFMEIKKRTTAHGGYADRDRVFWEDTKGIDITFSQGIFNELQFGLLCDGNLIYTKNGEKLLLPRQVYTESDENGFVYFEYEPVGNFFVYNKKTGEKIKDFEVVDSKTIKVSPYLEVVLDYSFNYYGGAKTLCVGDRLIEGFLCLEGTTRVKDDISGKVRTGILKIPKLKLMSDLSMRLGKNANPVMANFRVMALPVGERGNSMAMSLVFLNDDIDSDM